MLIIFLLLMPLAVLHAEESSPNRWHKPRADYKCLYNIESLMHCNEDISSKKIKWVVEKLRGTDVDAIMCCSTAWRMNMFPSEVDRDWKKFTHIRDLPAFQPYDYVMKYIHDGGDPVRDQLEASRDIGADFFISYRMNDWHNIHIKDFPTHNAFWREHPEYWLGDTNGMGFGDNLRLFNYMLPGVRDHYFAILEELCTNHDVDGLELDFQRVPRFFHDDEIEKGTPVMTEFVRRVCKMMDRIGKERGKPLRLCVRIPDGVAACAKAGQDVVTWDKEGLVDMINLSSFFMHNMEIDLEGVRAACPKAKLYGEMHVFYDSRRNPNYRKGGGSVNAHNNAQVRRATNFEIYRATAMKFFGRGADGVSFFNMDYVDGDCYNLTVSKLEHPLKRGKMPQVMRRITDLEFLAGQSKNYILYPNHRVTKTSMAARDHKALQLFVADDTAKVKFDRAVLRIETMEDASAHRIRVKLSGHQLEPCEVEDTELFDPIHRNAAFPKREKLKFFTVPPDRLKVGNNQIEITNLDQPKGSIIFFSLELGLYKGISIHAAEHQ